MIRLDVTTQRERRRVRARRVRRRRRAAGAGLALAVVLVIGGIASVGTSPGRGSVGRARTHPVPRRSSGKAAVRRAAPFTAPRVAPLVRPALRGEGVWQPATYSVTGSPAVLATTFRTAAGVTVYAALMDHTRTRLALYPGLGEPPVAAPRGPAEVPQGQRWRLLATFNGGFKHNSGAGGFLVNGRVDEPLQSGLGTVVEYRTGRVDIVSWHGQAPQGALVLARQNLPLLVDRGRASPGVGELWRWGVTVGHYAQVWRTALGIDRHGDLVYGAADAQTAASLAAVMIHLGAVRAVQLDINPEWPSFIAYGRRGGRSPDKLVPNYRQSADRYLSPDNRDFFAVYARPGGGPFVPFR